MVIPTTHYRFTNEGAKLIGTELTQYRALTRARGNVELSRTGEPLLRYRLALPQDTVSLDNVVFRAEQPKDHDYRATSRFCSGDATRSSGQLGRFRSAVRYPW